MGLSNTLISALQALSALPNLPPEELERLSQNVDDTDLAPDASFGADPVWRFQKGAPPPSVFASLLERHQNHPGLVGEGDFFAFELGELTIVVKQSTLRTIVDELAHSKLTSAEGTVALELLKGGTLRAAAEADNLSYETKRTHFKALANKLGIRSQSEVVRILTSYMLQRLAYLAQPQSSADLDQYAQSFLPAAVRRLSITTPTGLTVPVLDYGPITGKPMVVLHPMIFPPIGHEEIAQAEDLGLRLLWPLRSGLLDRSAPIRNGKSHLSRSVDGLLGVLEQLVGQPAPVLALVSSGSVAAGAAQRRPDLVERICFAATCYSAGRKNTRFSYFGTDLAELALRSEVIMTRTAAAITRYAGNDKRFRSIFETVFKGSPCDISHVAYEFGRPDAGGRLRSAVLHSSESIKQDYFNQTHFRWASLSQLDVPMCFLQGSEDSIHPPSELRELVQSLDGPELTVAQGMGHLPHRNDLRRAIEFTMSRTT